MTPVAFYAPLKSPNHANPSGDRALARALMQALELAGFSPSLASELRALDLKGDSAVQADLRRAADAAIPDLVTRGRAAGWRLWVSYHNYYKAPDLLGPAVARALDIPYVQIESTRARKRLDGPWANFAQAAEDAADAAAVIFYFTHRDGEALKDYAPKGQALVHLPPFLARAELPPPSTRSGPMVTAAMMRPGDKFDSYRLIARTLRTVSGPWQLHIAGDGAARAEVEALMAPFGTQVRFLGALEADGMAQLYSDASLLIWPGVNEAIGLIYLEAQAAGIPVLAQDRPGLRDVLPPHHGCPPPEAGSAGLRERLETLRADPPPAETLRAHIQAHHLLPAAAATLRASLGPLL